MGFELPDGKTARNIQDQVKFLTEKLKDLYAAFNQSGLKKIEIVDELPEVGNESILYLVPKDDPQTGDYFDEYLWIDNQWEFIGSTKLDPSTLVTTNTAQTITGIKTIPDRLIFKPTDFSQSYSLVIKTNGWTSEIQQVAGVGLNFGGSALTPTSDGNKSLGSSAARWQDIYLTGQVYANTINPGAGGVLTLGNGTGVTYCASGFLPLYNGLRDLGSSSYTWKDLYLSGNIHLGYSYIEKNDSFFAIKASSNDSYLYFVDSSAAYSRRLLPIDPTYDLGSSAAGRQWRDLYLTRNLTDGVNTVTVAEIGKVKTVNNVAPDASGNIAVATGTGLYLHTLTFSTGPANPIYLINSQAGAYTTRALLASAMAGSNCCCKLSTGQSIIQVDDTITKTTLYYLNGSLGITSVDITNSDTFTDTVTPYQQ